MDPAAAMPMTARPKAGPTKDNTTAAQKSSFFGVGLRCARRWPSGVLLRWMLLLLLGYSNTGPFAGLLEHRTFCRATRTEDLLPGYSNRGPLPGYSNRGPLPGYSNRGPLPGCFRFSSVRFRFHLPPPPGSLLIITPDWLPAPPPRPPSGSVLFPFIDCALLLPGCAAGLWAA